MNTSEILERVHAKSEWVRDDAKSMADYVAMLKSRRDFPTLAEAAMDEAEQELIKALQSVRDSRKAFNSKPLESQHAA